MPNLQNVVLMDRAATPVAHTFVPRGKIGTDGGRLVEPGITAIADRILTVEPRRTPGGRVKTSINLTLPVVQTKVESGVTSYVVTRTSRAKIEFDFAPDSTEQERKDLVGQMMNSLDPAKTLVNDVLTKLDAVW